MAPPRQFAGHPWSSCEVQNERLIVKSTFQPLNQRRFIRVSAALSLLAGLQRSRPAYAFPNTGLKRVQSEIQRPEVVKKFVEMF